MKTIYKIPKGNYNCSYRKRRGQHPSVPADSMKDEDKLSEHLIQEPASLKGGAGSAEAAEMSGTDESMELFDSLNDYVLAFDPTGTVVSANEPLRRRLGCKKDEIVGKNMVSLFPSRAQSEIGAIVSSKEKSIKKRVTMSFLSESGREVPVEGVFFRSALKNKKVSYFICRDVGDNQAGKLLEEQLYFLQGLIDAVPTPVYFKDADLRYLGVNKAFTEYHGFRTEDLLGRTISEVLPAEEAKRHSAIDRNLMEKGGSLSYEFKIYHPDGSVHNVINNKAVFRKSDGSVGGIVGVITDITERKKSAEELERQSHILDIITGQMEDMVYYKDKDFRYVFSSRPHCQRILKCSQEECMGRTVDEIVTLGESRQEGSPVWVFGRTDNETRKAGKPSKFEEMATIDGENVWLEIYNTPLYDDGGEFAGIVSCSRDITERKRSEQRLKESEERLRILIESTNDVITLQDRDGRFIYYNGMHRYGLEAGSILGKTPDEVFQPAEAKRMMVHLGYVFETGRSMTTEEDVVRDGERSWFNVNRYPIKDDKANIVSVATISRNITDRKRMEQDLIKVQKLESIGTLAGGIAHDFNNILTVMLGNITLAKMSISQESKAVKRLNDAEKATMRAKDLTQQLLTFAKGGEPFKKVTSINRLIEESVNLSLSGSNLRCEYEISDNLYPVEIDEGQIRQVIHNVMTNAKEAMPSGGVVTIRAANLMLDPENDLYLDRGPYVRIEFTDMGPGIPGAYLPKIFDPYFTTKEMGSQKGTGLGLAICYSIIRKHKGYIKVESKMGEGTTFSIFLPAYERERMVDNEIEESRPQSKGKVLLMDDEEMIREITAEILSALGYEADFAKDGEEAIDLYSKAWDSKRPFDVVILDLTIPGGMGGKEAIRKLLEINPEIKGIVSSGYSNDPVMSEFRHYGFSGIITKPFKIEELDEILRKTIEG